MKIYTENRNYIHGIALAIVLLISLAIAVSFGTVETSLQEVYQVFWQHLQPGQENIPAILDDIVWLIRLPRLLLACGIGMGLAVAGVVMQAIIKNPLADPYILGISSGAAVGATLTILLGVGISFGRNYVGISAFIGALTVAIIVLVIASVGGSSNAIKLLLAGMAVNAVCSSLSGFIVYIANNKDGIQSITYWLMGSLAGADWQMIGILLPIVVIATLFFLTQTRILNLMLLGDEVAITLGTDLRKYRQLYLLIIAFIVGLSVYAAGMIGFVGLIVPHVVRMLFGTDHKIVLPYSALIGAIFLLWSDVLCRTILPRGELPIGMLVSLIGAPFFIYLMVKKSYGFGGQN